MKNMHNKMFRISNLNRPSNKKFKRVADILLYLLPLYVPIIAALDPVSPKFSLWAVTVLSTVVVTLKGITKFTSEPDIVVVEESVEENTETEEIKEPTNEPTSK